MSQGTTYRRRLKNRELTSLHECFIVCYFKISDSPRFDLGQPAGTASKSSPSHLTTAQDFVCTNRRPRDVEELLLFSVRTTVVFHTARRPHHWHLRFFFHHAQIQIEPGSIERRLRYRQTLIFHPLSALPGPRHVSPLASSHSVVDAMDIFIPWQRLPWPEAHTGLIHSRPPRSYKNAFVLPLRVWLFSFSSLQSIRLSLTSISLF
jgi:hypothetical protein